MPYYDICDSDGNVIASNVFIDDGTYGGPSRPIVINWYKKITIIAFVVGLLSTFITPIILFLQKDAFVNNGWIYMVLFNILMGLPVFIIAINMLSVMSSKIKEDDPYYDVACNWVNDKLKFTDDNNSVDLDEMSDEEYICKMKRSYKNQAAISAVYVAIKYQNLLTKLSKLSYFIYPLAILSLIIEFFVGEEEVFFIVLFNLNFIAMFLGMLSVYRNYKSYQKKYCLNIKGRMIKTILLSFLASIPFYAIIISVAGTTGFYILIFCIAIMDLLMIIDRKIMGENLLRTYEKKKPIRLGVILVCTVCFTLLMLMVACGISLIPGPIYDVILAYDEGLSTDLTLPIIFWSVCLIVDILLIVIVSKIVSNKLDNRI